MKKINWGNLFRNKCPKCGMTISYKRDSQLFECALYDENEGNFSCDFSISFVKLERLKEKMKSQNDIRQFEHDNLESLNNLAL